VRKSGFDNTMVPAGELAPPQLNAMTAIINQPREVNPEVEAFLAVNPVQPHAANQLRNMPLHLQKVVLARGSLASARDKSAVLTRRMSDALAGQAQGLPTHLPPHLAAQVLGVQVPAPEIPGMPGAPGYQVMTAASGPPPQP
jgi:hypothetical protein